MTGFGTTLLSILEFIVAFGVLVFLHEFGHFITARLNKIEVEEFGFGFPLGDPPKQIKLFTAGGTKFTLNIIPFGGFCRMKGETGDVMEAGSFAAANPWRRLATLLGGPITNLLTGMLIISFIFSRTGSPDYSKVQIVDIAANSPAALNLKVGDLITKVNDTPITSTDKLTAVVSAYLDKPITISVLRDSKPLQFEITPRKNPPANEGAMGVTISNPAVKTTFIEGIPMAFTETMDQGLQLLMLPVKLITGQVALSQGRMVSVVGIYDMFAQVQTVDKQESAVDPSLKGLNILSFLALISIALGFTNLLPIPALDGGHILFLIPEILFKKRVKPELENRVHFVGYVLLMALMVIMVINDLIHPVILH
jgi:regulator of sigma E protease